MPVRASALTEAEDCCHAMPPRTNDEEARAVAVRDIEACNCTTTNPSIDRILEVLKTIMPVHSACYTFLRPTCVSIRQSDSDVIMNGADYEPPGLCFWLLVPEEPQMLVIEDLQLDARSATSPLVTQPPYLRFYAAVPLVSRNKQRLGTLCLLHTQPMKLGSARAAVLSNFAEILMWTLEGSVMAKMPRSPVLAGKGVRDKKLYGQACALVDTSQPGWRILFANTPFTDLTGCRADGSSHFWSLVQDGEEEFEDMSRKHNSSLRSMESFQISRIKLKAHFDAGMLRGANSLYDAQLRPATCSQIHDDANEVGNPARYPGDDEADWQASEMDSLFFLLLEPAREKRSGSNRGPISTLTVGTSLGAGSFAKVYRGTYAGEKVAVKVVKNPGGTLCEGGVPLEAVLMQGVRHPNLVALKTFKMARTTSGDRHLWLVLGYCDQGTFADGVDRGFFRTAATQKAPTCPLRVMHTARDMARGLAFLHSRGILHCDLSGANVLLQSCALHPNGFSARVADFGMCRRREVYYADVSVSGNYSYLAPEVMQGGPCTQESDIFALGILIYEALTGSKAWGGLSMFQVSYAVLNEGQSLTLENPCATGSLALSCMSRTPSERPTAAALVSHLDALLASPDAPLKPPATPSAGPEAQLPCRVAG